VRQIIRRNMKRLLEQIWKSLPKKIRLICIWLVEPRFTVTVGAILLDEDRRILLLRHAFRKGSGWGIPGGFIEKGEDPEEAIRRELREEVGLEIEIAKLAFARTFKHPQQIEIIYIGYPRGSAIPKSPEIEDAQWFTLDELPHDLGRDQRYIINRALK
jgi:8-oxo-dGTP diphosphatase